MVFITRSSSNFRLEVRVISGCKEIVVPNFGHDEFLELKIHAIYLKIDAVLARMHLHKRHQQKLLIRRVKL